MKIKYTLLITLIGILLGFIGGSFGAIAVLGCLALVTGAVIVLCEPCIAVCFLAGYGVIDWILRLLSPSLASIWDEAFLLGLVLLWIYKWIFKRSKDGKLSGFKTAPLDLPIIIYICTMLFVLILNTQDYKLSLEGFRAIIQYTLWYFVVLQLVDGKKDAKLITSVFVCICAIMAVHGVIQFAIGVEMPAGWVDQNEAGVRTRVFSILTSPNIFGSLLALASPMAIALALSSTKVKGRVLYSLMALVMLASLVFTFSRGAWIAFAVAAAFYILLKDKRLLVPGIILAVLVVLLVPSVGNRISYMLSPEYIESSLKGGRLVRWITGVRLLSFYPWLGVGLGNFGGAVAMNHEMQILLDADYVKTFYMDNYFLKTAVESGIVGLSSFVLVMYCVIINGCRTIKRAVSPVSKELAVGITAGLSGVITHNFVENVFETPLMASLFWIFAAVLMSIWNYEYNKQMETVK